MTLNTSHCGELYVCRSTESFSTLRKSMFCFHLYVFARKQLSTDRLRVKNSLMEKAGWKGVFFALRTFEAREHHYMSRHEY